MLSSVWLMVLTQLAVCTPGETSLVCSCKAGMVTACVTLVADDARRAAQVLNAVEGALAELDALEHASRMAGVLSPSRWGPPSCPTARARSITSSPGASPDG